MVFETKKQSMANGWSSRLYHSKYTIPSPSVKDNMAAGHGAFEFSMLQIMGETAPFNILHGCRYLVLDAKHLGQSLL